MEACIANIGKAQRRRRLITGAVTFAAAVALAAWLAAADASLAARSLVVIPLLGAGIGFFQYREKT